MSTDVFKGFIILFLILVPLERRFSLHKQKIFRKGWVTDAIHFFVGNLVGKAGLAICGILTISLFRVLVVNHNWQIKVASQPVYLQFIEAVLISEMGYYIAHKLTHEIPWLWKFHAIHHSVEHMDWLATVRLHPVDQIFTKMFQIVPLYLLGFTKERLGVYILFGAVIAFFIHANIKFKYGVFRWVVATPEFHHWHHSIDAKVCNKNFAAQLPILDLIFGTLYMPVGKMPDKYGISEPVPSGYIGQMLYPFRVGKRKMESYMQMLTGIRRSIRPLTVTLAISAIGISALSVTSYLTGLDIQSIITGRFPKQVTVAELQQGKLKPVLMIDVRSPEEYAEDRIGKSPLIPLTEIETDTGVERIRSLVQKSVQADRAKPTVVLYCTKGPRSVKAYKRLEGAGLKMAVLSGGITAWRKAVPAEQDTAVLSPIIIQGKQLKASTHAGETN